MQVHPIKPSNYSTLSLVVFFWRGGKRQLEAADHLPNLTASMNRSNFKKKNKKKTALKKF